MDRVLCSVVTFFIGTTAAAADLWLGVGEVRAIPAPAEAAVRVAQRGVVRVVDAGPRAVRLIAMKPGETSLLIGARATTVHVTDGRQLVFQRELRALVTSMRGLRLEFARGRPEVAGSLLRVSDWREIAELADRHRGEYTFRARALRDVGERALAHLAALARGRGYPLVRFNAQPEFTAVLPASAGHLRPRVERLFGSFGIRVELAEDDLRVQPLIRTHVVFAEVSRGFGRTIGVSWPSEYAAHVLPRAGGEAELTAALRALEARGEAQILASPDLSCRSGGEARVAAGGELPIRVASRQRQGVEWKNFGVELNVRPRADHQGNLSVDLRGEISTVDFAHAVDGVPSLKKTAVQSQFDLPGRRTIVLSGLIRSEVGRTEDGLPLLSHLPILGRLFGSRRYQRHQSELVVFVTPEIYQPGANDKIKMPEGWVDGE